MSQRWKTALSPIRPAVLAAITQVRADRALPPADIVDTDLVGAGGLGLDSLDMATVVAQLDEDIGLDPFAVGNARFRTVGELVALYESAE